MILELNGFELRLSLAAMLHGHWVHLRLDRIDKGYAAELFGLKVRHIFQPPREDRIDYSLSFTAPFETRLRLGISLPTGERDLFHLIPGNIHGDNNAAHVRPGEFPCLVASRAERNCAPLWEFRADRASHPVSIVCCASGAVGVSIDPYSSCTEKFEGFIRNGVFAALPDVCGVSLGYGNDPLTFHDKTCFLPATADFCHGADAQGTIFACRGAGRAEAHRIIESLHSQLRDVPKFRKTPGQALRALADAFVEVNYDRELHQYTNRKCQVPTDTTLRPWRAIVEIGWTGGSMMAYPFALAEKLLPGLEFPKSSSQIFNEICGGFSEASGFIDDTTINRNTQNRPPDWNDSTINGWWSGFLPNTRDNHCAYTNGHAAYYLLRTSWMIRQQGGDARSDWVRTALSVLQTVVDLQRDDGAVGYIFSSLEKEVIDFDGFAGCWFAAALVYAWKLTGEARYRESCDHALRYYARFVDNLACWGAPMDTFKSIDSEGNLAFIRAARLMHEFTDDAQYLTMLKAGARYEYLWRYCYRTRPQCPPLAGSGWNSCGGSITSVSNPHIHPMGVVATGDLEYLARITDNGYHRARAEDGFAWLMNTMELYPDAMGYGRYGVLSERTCPSDGLLSERFSDTGAPASTWWSYNAWAAASAMEAIAEKMLANREPA